MRAYRFTNTEIREAEVWVAGESRQEAAEKAEELFDLMDCHDDYRLVKDEYFMSFEANLVDGVEDAVGSSSVFLGDEWLSIGAVLEKERNGLRPEGSATDRSRRAS